MTTNPPRVGADLTDEDRERHGLPVIWDVMSGHLDEVGKCVDHMRVSSLWGDREGLAYHWDRTREAFDRARVVRNKLLELAGSAAPLSRDPRLSAPVEAKNEEEPNG